MQATTRFHHHIAYPMSPQAAGIFDDATAFYSTDRMLNTDTYRRYLAVFHLLLVRQAFLSRFFLRLQDRHPWQRKSLKAGVLRKDAAFWYRIALFIGDPFIMHAPRIGPTQKLHDA